MIAKQVAFSFIGFLFLIIPVAWTQQVSLQTMQSLEEWRWGVIAFNDGLSGKALLSMERANTLNPTDPLIKEWLGRAYWKSGMEDAALSVWESLMDQGETSNALKNRVEILRSKVEGKNQNNTIKDELIPLTSFDGGEGLRKIFQRPSAVRSLGDNSGSLIISSYSDGELVVMDVNGVITDRFEGGVEGFLLPFDILPVQGDRLLVSEFQADRISVVAMNGLNKGYRIETWGETGKGDAQFLGPQYMALATDGGHVYISDWGNRRISKWRLDGSHVLNFSANSEFKGFSGPTGIACYKDKVYVADSLMATIETFDASGNYIGSLVTEGLREPEGLSIRDGKLLVADGSSIYQVDLISGEMIQETSFSGDLHRITTVFPVDNGNLAISDFNLNRVVLLTPLSTLYGGLDVTLDRVMADNFPEISIDLTVKDRSGNPITGLNHNNFRIFDGDLPVNTPVLEWRSFLDDTVSLGLVVDTSANVSQIESLFQGVEDVVGKLIEEDEFSIIEATTQPLPHEVTDTVKAQDIYKMMLSNAGTKKVAWGDALRLAVDRIAVKRRRKAVIAFVNDLPAADSFDRYGLVETARMMVNNGIVFYAVYGNRDMASGELDYIAKETGGQTYYLFRPEGVGGIVNTMKNSKIGRYTVSWETPRSSGYGRDYLPVSVEVIYISKSGRAESGTFASLQ